ncbi:hypothetical protein [Mucilaginibacter sp.]
MKRYLVPPVLLKSSFFTYVRDIARRSNKLVALVKTYLFTLKSNKKVWMEPSDSPCKNMIVAKGNYKDGKRVGTWVFTSDIAGIIESYNYDENIILIDSSDLKIMEFALANNNKASNLLTSQAKIGGFFCSIPPSVFQRELPLAIYERFPGGIELVCTHTFILGLTGAVIKHAVRVKYDNIEKGYAWDENMPDTEFKRFIPPFYSDYD